MSGSRRALVTGAPGWLGTRLVEQLVLRGFAVRCLVHPDAENAVADAEIVRGDLRDTRSLAGITDGIDVVFHAAGLIHPPPLSLRGLFDVNTAGTKNLLAEGVRSGVRRFVYVSSNSAAGCNVSRDTLLNEYSRERPYMAYGRSKLEAEQYVNDVFVRGLLETVIVRPCWFYGPGQPQRQTRLMNMIIVGKAPLFGDGLNLRSMTEVDSLCDALIRCATETRAAGELYWIADERPYTTRHVYETIARLLDVELRTSSFPKVASDLSAFGDRVLQALHVYQMEIHVAGEMYKDIACSVTKAKKDLGWEPPTDLTGGMARSIAWARERGLLAEARG